MCARPAGWGTDHPGFGRCKLHGGSTANHRKSAMAQVVRADAEALLAHEGLTDIENPVEELARLAVEAWAMKDALAARVNALAEVRFVDGKGSEQLRAEVVLYERALDRTGKFLEVLARLGYEARRDQVNRELGDRMAAIIERVLDALDLTVEQRARTVTAVPAVLRAIDSGAA